MDQLRGEFKRLAALLPRLHNFILQVRTLKEKQVTYGYDLREWLDERLAVQRDQWDAQIAFQRDWDPIAQDSGLSQPAVEPNIPPAIMRESLRSTETGTLTNPGAGEGQWEPLSVTRWGG